MKKKGFNVYISNKKRILKIKSKTLDFIMTNSHNHQTQKYETKKSSIHNILFNIYMCFS